MTTSAVFVPSNLLEERIHAGDFDGMIAALRAMSQKQREAQFADLMRIEQRIAPARLGKNAALSTWWGSHPSYEHSCVLHGALFFCGSSKIRGDLWIWDNRLYPFLDMLEPAALKSLATDLPHPVVAHRLIVDGLSDRPDNDEYIIGLIGAPRWTGAGKSSLLGMINADPGLLDGPIMRMFEVEGSGDTCIASMDKYARGDNSWTHALLELARTGKLSREQLLDATVSVLEKDWPQFRAGWFSRFHDALAPSVDEMAPLRSRYLGLCHSRIPPTVTLALGALGALYKGGHLDGHALVEALVPVMSAAVKGQVDAGLKLLDQAVKKHANLAPAASATALRALAHESPELHKKVLARLTVWGLDDAARADLALMLPHVSAANRDVLAALAGIEADLASEPVAAPAMEAGLACPLDGARRLVPVDSVDELVQTIAFVFENDADIDQLERALDALGRMAPLLPGAQERFSPVLKRAKKILKSDRLAGPALASLLAYVFEQSPLPADREANSVQGELSRRVADLAAFMAKGSGVSPLSSATHRRGFIDPLLLVERIEAHARCNVQATLDEQVRALLRLAPGDWPDALRRARAVAQTPFVQAVRYALGDDVVPGPDRALFLAAARIRHPNADDPRLLAAYGDMGPDGPCAARYRWILEEFDYPDDYRVWRMQLQTAPAAVPSDPAFIAIRRHEIVSYSAAYYGEDEAKVLYAASMLPGNLEGLFARAALLVGTNIDWWEPQWHDKAYFELLIDPATNMTPGAVMLLAFGLGSKEPGLVAMAVDAFVAAVVEGRSSAARVALDIRAILLSPLGLSARYAKSLGSAARANASMPRAVCDALCTILQFGDVAAPKDTAKLLELLLEVALGSGLALPPGAREAIARLKLTGKAKLAQGELLAKIA